jgi:hypothetical protein
MPYPSNPDSSPACPDGCSRTIPIRMLGGMPGTMLGDHPGEHTRGHALMDACWWAIPTSMIWGLPMRMLGGIPTWTLVDHADEHARGHALIDVRAPSRSGCSGPCTGGCSWTIPMRMDAGMPRSMLVACPDDDAWGHALQHAYEDARGPSRRAFSGAGPGEFSGVRLNGCS